MRLDNDLQHSHIPKRIRIAFCQVSDKLIKPSDHEYRQFYSTCYRSMPGFHFREDFLDIPHWIPIISGRVDRSIEQTLIIVENIEAGINRIRSERFDYVLFSVMNVNAKIIMKIISECADVKFLLGGYVDATEFSQFPNCTFLDDPKQLLLFPLLNYQADLGPRYHLFNDGMEYIPRFTLSTGCKHHCNFCSVPRLVEPVDQKSIDKQLASLTGIKHSLLYIDDKTFGQCDNYRTLSDLFVEISKVNKEFRGFIVQSTATQLLANGGQLLSEAISDLRVKYIEIGIETCRDDLLRSLKKPHRMKHVREVCEILRAHNGNCGAERNSDNVYLIPNLIFGIPGDDYAETLRFIDEYIDVISTFNYANLSVYPGRRGGDVGSTLPGDDDDYSFRKSWLSDKQINAGMKALSALMTIFRKKYSPDLNQLERDESAQLSFSTVRHQAANNRVACDSPSGSGA
ncbi:radical SAM protein [Rhodobacteraceae bacterium 2CG4]|uniref:Radical SAM protein n=1 Tax=Halovulum marinum TaxID=2662447 RepID=A0A6L5Z1R0_9RHOB|nr:radical SAM protein [Halovulum marinum]MSU90501.1 radical SAM protein [Halovulum marinum]